MKIYIGSDHNGFQLKGRLSELLSSNNYHFIDDGDDQLNPDDDFPVFAAKVVNSILVDEDPDSRGILICGSGQGMCMAANRFKGIRACLGYDVESVRASRNDDDSNILCIPGRVLSEDSAVNLVRTWLETPFANSTRFVRRIKEMDNLN